MGSRAYENDLIKRVKLLGLEDIVFFVGPFYGDQKDAIFQHLMHLFCQLIVKILVLPLQKRCHGDFLLLQQLKLHGLFKKSSFRMVC